MSKQHPYPDHIVEAMKEQISKGYGDLYVCTRDDSAWSHGTMSLDDFHRLDSDEDVLDDLANDMLEMLWEASRVDTVEQLDALPDEAVINDGYFTQTKDVNQWTGGFHQFANNDQIDLPVHVIYWGDSDEQAVDY